MKRSEINAVIEKCEAWVTEMGFHLPPWAHWTPEHWRDFTDSATEVFDNMLGWDVTDFNKGDYASFGLTLFTIRNGNPQRDRKLYAEKILIVSENQGNPMHFHYNKMEDIINRGGGLFVVEAFASTPGGELSNEPFSVTIDGIRKTYPAGTLITLAPGESICIEPGLYHRFFAEGGPVLVGEVSMVNDDRHDNRFQEELCRYSDIEEDEGPYRLLCGEYKRFLS